MIDTVQFARQYFNISNISWTQQHTAVIPAPEMPKPEQYYFYGSHTIQ